ncbi:MAG: hypothetical protein CME60_14335 [Halobacteriovoraceae bacterium]|nr:hypothetical protein [Halobacteriovoraceae bacterium]
MESVKPELKPFTIKVKGRSMWPLLRDGDVVTIQTQVESTVGDIVCVKCHESGEIVIHRKLASGVTKGDNSLYYDRTITILGRADINFALFPFFKNTIQKLSNQYNSQSSSLTRKLIKSVILFCNILTILSSKRAPA